MAGEADKSYYDIGDRVELFVSTAFVCQSEGTEGIGIFGVEAKKENIALDTNEQWEDFQLESMLLYTSVLEEPAGTQEARSAQLDHFAHVPPDPDE